MVLAVLCVGIFLIQLDVTVVNVALPAVRMDLHTGLAGQQWVVDGYMLALAGLLLLCGMLGDRIGHRRVVLAGLSVFGLASLACGTAPSIELLIAWRAVQGVGAALLLPGTLALITSLYADAAARARAMGLWAGAGALALPSGPLLGGALVHALGWRAVFLVNLPVIGLAMPIAYRLIPPTRSRGARVPRRLPAATAGAGCTPNSVGQPLTSMAARAWRFISAGQVCQWSSASRGDGSAEPASAASRPARLTGCSSAGDLQGSGLSVTCGGRG
ncbi:MFS transporter [Kribbella ginsengisoli]|uniref:Major facilitator superfamily (MFS) profile domain-containing protein n=1 Tax=Kribbella ginsengisoli TaxID=363865 RepID=A0ABP6Z4L1_9ACTN